jgi:hypothetical protein
MNNCATSLMLSAEEAYQLWAPEYDSAPNPLFDLEVRHLAPLLQSAAHCDVVDLGCGTALSFTTTLADWCGCFCGDAGAGSQKARP